MFDCVVRKAGREIAFEPEQIVNCVVELTLVKSPKNDLVAALASQNLDGTLQFRIDALDHGIEFILFRRGSSFGGISPRISLCDTFCHCLATSELADRS